MSITSIMHVGASGLRAETGALGVVGNNVANANTIGFKYSRANFEDVLGGNVGQSAVGAGSRLARTQQIFSQGSLTNTGVSTDLAISGDGFFIVKGAIDGFNSQFYTRAGQMTVRDDGTLVNMHGLELQGYPLEPATGTFSASLDSLKVSSAALPPKVTTQAEMVANLDSNAQTPGVPWDPQDPANTSNFSSSITVYDSLGNSHKVELYFRKSATNTWEYHGIAQGSEVTPPVPGNQEFMTGTLAFNAQGKLVSDTVTAGGTIDFNGATPGQAIAFDFGDAINTGGSGQTGMTQYGGPSSVTKQTQDGYSTGEFVGVEVTGEGEVRGIYTNGEHVAAGKVALGRFRAKEELRGIGHNLFMETRAAGEPAIGTASSGGRGQLVSAALEESNVDIASEFVRMIAHQRAFSANSRTISTADEMTMELVNLKR